MEGKAGGDTRACGRLHMWRTKRIARLTSPLPPLLSYSHSLQLPIDWFFESTCKLIVLLVSLALDDRLLALLGVLNSFQHMRPKPLRLPVAQYA